MAKAQKLPTMQQLLRYWYSRLKAEEIAQKLGISRNMLRTLQSRYKLPAREADKKRPRTHRITDPTEEEIAHLKHQIRASWSEKEAARRWVGPARSSAWQPPSYSYDQSNGTFLPQ